MNDQIKINPVIMKKRVTEYRKQSEKLDEVIKEMDKLLETLQSEWEGKTSRDFYENYKKLKPHFTSAKNQIDTFATNLDTAAKNFEAADGRK